MDVEVWIQDITYEAITAEAATETISKAVVTDAAKDITENHTEAVANIGSKVFRTCLLSFLYSTPYITSSSIWTETSLHG